MTNKIDTEYWVRRERQERERADCANDKLARDVHAEMADRYASLAQNQVITSNIPPRG